MERAGTERGSLFLLVFSAGLVLSIAMGLRQTLGLFLGEMSASVGVTAAEFGFAMAVQNLAWGVTQPLTGMLADRYGARPVALAAGPVYALGLALMATAGGLGLQLGGGLLVGLGVSGSAFGVVLGAVARGVPGKKKGLAVAIVSAAGSLGTLVLAPLGEWMIQSWGWVFALLTFAAVALAISLFAWALEGPRRVEGSAAAPNARAAVAEALAHRGFLALTLAFFACGFQLVFITTHLPSYLDICGVPPSVSAAALGVIGACNAVGTLAIGGLGARFGNGPVLAAVYALRTLAIALFISVPVTAETTLLFAAAMGFLWLSVVPLVSGLVTGMFGTANFGTLFGIAFFSHQVGSFFGAWLGGLSVDLTGSYLLGWWSLIAVGAAAFLLQATAPTGPRRAGAAA